VGAPEAPRPVVPQTPQMRMLLAAVKQARLYATMAVAADKGQDYESAAGNYRAAVKSLKGEIDNVPPEDLDMYNERIEIYERRAEMIELMKLGNKSSALPVPNPLSLFKESGEKPIRPIRPTQSGLPDPLPDDDIARTFWLIRTLIKTLNKGGFIAPRIYITPDVWYEQNGAKLEHLTTKCCAFVALLEALQKVQESVSGLGSNAVPLGTELSDMNAKAVAIQCVLADKFSTIDRVPCDESVLKTVKKSMERDPNAPAIDVKKYAQAVNNLLKESLAIEKWMELSRGGDVQMISLVKFFKNIVLPIIVGDLKTLLLRYMHRYGTQITAKE